MKEKPSHHLIEMLLFTKMLYDAILVLWTRHIISHLLHSGRGKSFVYVLWNQDDEQSRALYFIPFPSSQASVRRFAEEATVKRPEGDNFRFVIENSEQQVVGDITTYRCDPRIGNFSWGINIKQEHRRKGYASEALQRVMRYYFQELRYQKVTVFISSFNEASIGLHEHLSFQKERRMHQKSCLYQRTIL